MSLLNLEAKKDLLAFTAKVPLEPQLDQQHSPVGPTAVARRKRLAGLAKRAGLGPILSAMSAKATAPRWLRVQRAAGLLGVSPRHEVLSLATVFSSVVRIPPPSRTEQ